MEDSSREFKSSMVAIAAGSTVRLIFDVLETIVINFKLQPEMVEPLYGGIQPGMVAPQAAYNTSLLFKSFANNPNVCI